MITLDGMALPGELIWQDEWAWNEYTSTMRRTIGGVMVIFDSHMVRGRPITLGGDDAWITRAALDDLSAMVGHGTHTLVLHDDRTFTVRWRLWDTPVLDVEQLASIAYQTAGTYWVIRNMKMVTL